MSFFGLTSFGPESIIQSSLVNSNGFTLFSDEEYFEGFTKTENQVDEKQVKVKNLKDILHNTFEFSPLNDEVNLLKKMIGKSDEENLSWEEFYNGLVAIREHLNVQAKVSKKFDSYKTYYNERYKHIRNEHKPNDTFKLPVSSGQYYGFYNFKERNLNNERYPKINCEETKYAEAIVMTGKNFMK